MPDTQPQKRPEPKQLAKVSRATQFQPGQSGNPGGKPAYPRPLELIRERAEAQAEAVLGALFDALRAGDDAPDHAIRLRAANDILDRVYGKPTQRTEMSGGMTLEQLIADNPAEVAE